MILGKAGSTFLHMGWDLPACKLRMASRSKEPTTTTQQTQHHLLPGLLTRCASFSSSEPRRSTRSHGSAFPWLSSSSTFSTGSSIRLSEGKMYTSREGVSPQAEIKGWMIEKARTMVTLYTPCAIAMQGCMKLRMWQYLF